ncbi:MAG: SDR family oxidoreductase [Xanthomonadales bacterium]|nr:SDR family oxidoreductase [Xanthomonadales bacterium]
MNHAQRPAEKVALVSGGSAGIGESICQHLLAEGYTVLNLSRRPAAKSHDRLIDVPVDLSELDATKAVLADLSEQYAITTLVHNAGVIRAALIEDVDVNDLVYMDRLHVHAAVLLMQAVLPAMKKACFGRVVLIGSRGMLGLKTRTGYAASKAAQIGLVRTWALELGEHGITVNAVAPGPIVTDMFTEVIPEGSGRAAQIAASIPVKRLGRADDVARAVMFLVAADNSFVTGQTLFVCGGASIGSLSL